MANKRIKPLRWTMELAGVEFGMDHRALSRRVRRAGLTPADDGCFSTRQICSVVFGDKEAEDLRKVTQEADKLELQNRKARGELIESDAVYRHFEALFIVIRQRILASKLDRQDQDDLLRELQNLSYEDLKASGIGLGDSSADDDPDSAAEADVHGVG